MGRRPNALILQYFERGPKLQDQSNRYPHTCKACGEHFPRGRLDSLTSHLTKKCPAISEAERVNALLTLSGMSHASQRFQQSPQAQAQAQAHAHAQANGSAVDLPMIQRDWTALGVLAEVSRQIDLNEKNDDRGQPNGVGPPAPAAPPAAQPAERFELQEQFTMENPPLNQENSAGEPTKAETQLEEADQAPTAEERLQEILRAEDTQSESANITMAAAATARLHPSFLDPEMLGEEADAAADAANATANANAAATTTTNNLPMADMTGTEEPAPAPSAPSTPAVPTPSVPPPWGELTYATDSFQATITNSSPMQTTTGPLGKGVFRLDGGPNGAKSRHSRARFNATRRKEVQEVRKIGACIRCRVLRKTCSQGSPCDTCRKVLSPRVWRSGCVRTKFSEQLDLYSAGVQIVLAQARVNSLKQAMTLGSHGVLVEACHFPDCAPRLQLQVLQRDPDRDAEGKLVDASIVDDRPSSYPIVMLDNDNQDVPAAVETYMREILPDMIRREPSHFMQATLQTAVDVAGKTNDELLKKSLELWGLVEILDRERQWTISAKTWAEDTPAKSIKEDTDGELFNTICLQLAAAAERKAAATSKALLTGMQRVLQDSKVRIDFNMYFAVLILLNCVEKSSWAFKAWEQENLRHLWPLEKEPVSFAQQGYVIANLLHMLLGIRKALPRTARREVDGKLVTEEENSAIREYFEAINLDFAQVKAKHERPAFSPTDSRSFELLFCSTLLLPNSDS
ncbi:hypothetical protein C8A00DRAFT_15947 [Chaetomidium leptoderma]|uniref:Zn(2)-C6 fungal-type domain-containing protein n=1 Tax=Chaetomidium leptoderma TaxID=669021 RepID=A0AAN6VJN4_9PEZI|nr:hypothetical protein C8A00DRAFT_15947 [Chaetomidium leptoderma]